MVAQERVQEIPEGVQGALSRTHEAMDPYSVSVAMKRLFASPPDENSDDKQR